MYIHPFIVHPSFTCEWAFCWSISITHVLKHAVERVKIRKDYNNSSISSRHTCIDWFILTCLVCLNSVSVVCFLFAAETKLYFICFLKISDIHTYIHTHTHIDLITSCWKMTNKKCIRGIKSHTQTFISLVCCQFLSFPLAEQRNMQWGPVPSSM